MIKAKDFDSDPTQKASQGKDKDQDKFKSEEKEDLNEDQQQAFDFGGLAAPNDLKKQLGCGG